MDPGCFLPHSCCNCRKNRGQAAICSGAHFQFSWVCTQEWSCWVTWWLCLTFHGNSDCFPQLLHRFTSPSAVHKGTNFSTSLPALVILHFYFIITTREGVSGISWWLRFAFCQAFVHVLVGHPLIFSGEVFVNLHFHCSRPGFDPLSGNKILQVSWRGAPQIFFFAIFPVLYNISL